MTFNEFIEELKQKDIKVSFSEGKLQYSGPEENINPELIEKLKEFKGKLIKYFWPKELGNLMPINPVGNKIPLFIVHGDNSNYIISEYFGKDQPVYGFFHPGSEGEKIPFKSAKVMAKDYLDKILAVHPLGPYYLIGYSFGGILAFEMAIQLQKLGKEVPFLALIDTVSPLVHEPIKWHKNLFTSIRLNILRPIRRRLKHRMKLLICNTYILRKKPIPVGLRSYYLWIKYSLLTKKYSPSKFDGDILLFRTTENPYSLRLLGWESLVKNIRVIEIDGKHLDIFIGKNRTDILRTEIEKHLISTIGFNQGQTH
jgi:thioesterase domain-containing protein